MAPLDDDQTFGSDKAGGLTAEELDAHWMPFTGNREFKSNPRVIETSLCASLKAAGWPCWKAGL